MNALGSSGYAPRARCRRMALFAFIVLLAGSQARPAFADEPGQARRVPDEPALRREGQRAIAPSSTAATASGWWSRRPRGPRLEVSWRTFDLAEMAGRRGRYHMFAADYFFISGLLRAGAGLEGGFDAGPSGNFLVGTDLRFGIQWPTRVTPSLEAVLGLGALRLDVLHDSLVCFAYQLGIEAGAHVFVHPKVFLSFGLGWRRLGYRQPGNEQVQPVYVYNDTLSIRVGAGF